MLRLPHDLICSKSKQKSTQDDFTALWWPKVALRWLIIERSPKVSWCSTSGTQLQATFSSHFWFFTSVPISEFLPHLRWSQSDLSTSILYSREGTKPPQRSWVGSALQRQGWQQGGFLARVSVPKEILPLGIQLLQHFYSALLSFSIP